MTNEPFIITDNLDELLAVLPPGLAAQIGVEERGQLVEIVLDLGRKPEARFTDRYAYLREEVMTREELDFVEARLGAFGGDNRAGIPATLHRISAMRNRRGVIVGLTLRVGRAVMGIVDILRDLIANGDSLLLMGRPGLGKTTLLREMARVMADEEGKRVVIVDTSNEIAGDGDVPHPAIGRARRMQVPRVEAQHDVMIEAVENHMPEVIVIDEIGRLEETLAARTIAERGVQLIATVHGNTLDNLLANPAMSDLIGGIQAVTLSDEEARRRGTQKTVLERKAPPTFDVVIEMIERDKIAVRSPVVDVVDALLRGFPAPPQIRWRDENGDVQSEQAAWPEQTPEHEFDNHERHYEGRSGRHESRRGGRRDDRRDGERPSRNGGRRDESRGTLSPVYGGALSARNGKKVLPEYTVEVAHPASTSRWADPDFEPELPNEESELLPVAVRTDEVPIDVARIRRVYPFGVSRSRLARAIKHLGLPLTIARSWNEADAVLMLAGEDGVPASSTMLREARELKLPFIGVRGNTYGQILSRLHDLFSGQATDERQSPRDLALQEARNAAQRVMAQAEPVELRPQSKPMRRLQHQIAERFHLRSYSVGREPNRRVRFLPTVPR